MTAPVEPATVLTGTARVRHGSALVSGLRLHHLDFGEQPAESASADSGVPVAGRTVVCLHGVTGTAWVWHDVAARLGPGFRVVALDLRGHGDSQWPGERAYATRFHVADLAARLGALGSVPVDLVGSSWGALVALTFAAAAPGRVRSLAIVDVEASFGQGETEVPPRPRSFADHGAAVAFERANNPHAPEALLDVVALGGTRPGPDGTLVPKHDPFFFERWPFRSDDVWSLLPALEMPTLLVHAEGSFVRGEVMERMAAAIPTARLEQLPDAVHTVPVDNPGGLAEHLGPFLREA